MLTVYTIAFNEEIILPYMIKWYRQRFPECRIVVYDNYSEDNTEKIALDNDCKVVKFGKKGELSNSAFLHVKNNCWKTANTNWVLVCDVDEMLDITEEDLKKEERKGVSIIKSKGWDVVNMKDDFNIDSMDCGCNSPGYSKNYLFDRSKINEINYDPGCHTAKPYGFVKYSDKEYNLFHKRYVNTDFLIQRYKQYNKRRSEEDIKYGWAAHYAAKESEIRKEIEEKRKHCQKI